MEAKQEINKTNKKSIISSDEKAFKSIPQELLLRIHENMVKARVTEERVIKVYKQGEGYFWIGGPGEEAWSVPLGLLIHKGEGIEYDWLHLHYRASPTLIAMGMPMIDAVRLMMNRVTDVSTGGRNFANHFCYKQWNIPPVSSVIEIQYSMAIGTAIVQKKHKSKGITIVTGGDAGTAEGDFATGLIWASRKGQELPMLITVQNNHWGISTAYEGQHGETHIADRAKAFNIRSTVVNGLDPIESYIKLKEDMDYIRSTGKPAFQEAIVSRLYGHSSADGANRRENEICPIKPFEERLLKAGYITEKEIQTLWQKYEDEGMQAFLKVKEEPHPQPETIWDHIFVNNENADWRKF